MSSPIQNSCKPSSLRAQNNEDKSSRFQLSKKTHETTQQVAGHTDLTHPTVQGKLWKLLIVFFNKIIYLSCKIPPQLQK